MATVEKAVERATMGIARAHVMTDEERRVVAVHEAGHVIVALDTDEGSLPHMVSIIPAGTQGGRTWLTDTHDRIARSKSALIDEMAMLLGGRTAEQIVFGEVGSGASSDLAKVGHIAHTMVTEFGMSEVVGPIGYAGEPDENGRSIWYSDVTARTIDTEARRLVQEAEDRAEQALQSSRAALDRLAAALLEAESLDADEIKRIVAAATPQAAAGLSS
jgi:cell division protease FtsH